MYALRVRLCACCALSSEGSTDAMFGLSYILRSTYAYIERELRVEMEHHTLPTTYSMKHTISQRYWYMYEHMNTRYLTVPVQSYSERREMSGPQG